MKITALFTVSVSLLFAFQSAYGQQVGTISRFPLKATRLLPGIFKDAENTDRLYMMQLVPDRLLAPYRREAGLSPKADGYGNWEKDGLDGHMAGHYLSALSMLYAETGDADVLKRLNYMIDELKSCQDKNGDGYVGGIPGSKELWKAVRAGDISTYKKKWVPFYNIHKTFAGIRDAYLNTGNKVAGEMLKRFADWFVQLAGDISDVEMQQLLHVEHGGVNEVLADVYAMTGDKKYLKAAHSFSERSFLDPLENGKDRLDNMHANTQIPKVIGFERIAEVSADSSYHRAAEFFWGTVIKHRTVAIGGNSVREHFNPSRDFSSMMSSEQGPETCNTYNMLKLTGSLFISNPAAAYMDYYERALYNHILTTQDTGKGGFVYFTPIRPGHYRVYSRPETSMWCCVGSGMESQAKYGEMIYVHSASDLFVNLFIPSVLNWEQKGLTLTQETAFPESERTLLRVNSVRDGKFRLRIRYPSWVSPGGLHVLVNGAEYKFDADPSGYIIVGNRTWKKGDVISISLPMHTVTEQLPDGSNYEAVVHGPLVMAAMLGEKDMTGLFADDSRMGHIARGKFYPMQDMPLFVSKSANDAAQISLVPGSPLKLDAGKLIYPASYRSLKLIPFYKVHASRYVIYWRKETPETIERIERKMALEETEKADLAKITTDVVDAGEQQPESDHFIESENSRTGTFNNRHFRAANGWFSYKLADKERLVAYLQVTYFGAEKNKHFSIWVNGQRIASVELNGDKGEGFFSGKYALPAGIVKSSPGVLTVKFLADTGSEAGPVYEVRLLKK